MRLLSRVMLIGIMLVLLSQSMLSSATKIQPASAPGTTGTSDTSINPPWHGIGSDWRIYQPTPQNPNGTPLTLPELLQGWQADINDHQKKYGLNSIRLAFSFADSGENSTHNVLNMTELDDVLQLFSNNSIKVILDLHNWDDSVRNVTDMPGFFGSSKWITDWKDVASRYKDDTEILAYEIFNEPSNAFGTWDPSVTGGGCGIPYNGSGKSVTMALAECVDAIRSVGDNHTIIYPDPHYFTVANDENDPEMFFKSADSRQNIVITFHDYFQIESAFQGSWNYSIKLQKSWESYYPIWIGEFGMSDNSSFQTEVNTEIIRWAVDNQVGFNMFVARSNPTTREEQWNMSESVLTALWARSTTSLVVRGLDDRIYYRVRNGTEWEDWTVLPGATVDSPAAAMNLGSLHFVVRGADGYSLWYGNLTDPANVATFSGWTLLDGATSSAPTLTSNGTVLCLVGRGLDNRVYHRYYTSSWGPWHAVPTGATYDTPAAAMLGNELHIVVRGMDGSSLWDTIVSCDGTVVRGWNPVSGATPSKPVLACSSTDNLCLVVRGMDNAIYYRNYTGSTDSWAGWNAFPTGATNDAPAATVMENILCTVVRGSDGNTLWCGNLDLGASAFSGWTLISGATSSAPTLTS